MNVSAQWTFPATLFLVVIAALLIRVVPLYDDVMEGPGVRFQGIDAYYHVRLTRYVVEHYPHRLAFDPLRLHPDGQRVDVYPAFDLLTATAALIAGLGSPSARTVDVTLAWMPPVLGALTVLFAGLGGRLVGGSAGGLAAAMLVAFLPGGTLSQTMIGFADHHALESLLLALSWFLVLRTVDGNGSFRGNIRPTILLGITAGVYILTWEGSPVLPATLIAFFCLRYILEDVAPDELLRRAASHEMLFAVVALVLLAGGFRSPMVIVSAVLFLVLPLLPLSLWTVKRMLPSAPPWPHRIVWLVLLAGTAAVTVVLLPDATRHALETNIARLYPSFTARTVSEMRPLISEGRLVWQFLGPALGWGVFGIIVVLPSFRQAGSGRMQLAAVLGIVFLPIALLQIRFAASASLALGLLSAAVAGLVFQGTSAGPSWRVLSRRWVRAALTVAWLGSVPVWSVVEAFNSSFTDRGPLPDWTEAMEHLRREALRGEFPATEGEHARAGVLNWWDSGYYLTTLAGLPPVSNPTQAGAFLAAEHYLDTQGNPSIDTLRQHGVGFVITEAKLAMVLSPGGGLDGTFPVLPIWAQIPTEIFFRTVYFPMPSGQYEPRFAFTPSYFRSLHTRLLLYGGKAAIPEQGNVWVLRSEPTVLPSGTEIEVITSAQSVPRYEEAEAFVSRRQESGWWIASFSPFGTCVPLEDLQGIEETFTSPTIVMAPPALPAPVSALRVFRILP